MALDVVKVGSVMMSVLLSHVGVVVENVDCWSDARAALSGGRIA